MTEISTEKRQEAVKELIKKEKISDQMQLVTLLKEQYWHSDKSSSCFKGFKKASSC